MKTNNAANEILELILAECRYWHGRDEARRGSFAILYAAAKKVADEHDKATIAEPGTDLLGVACTSCPNCDVSNAP